MSPAVPLSLRLSGAGYTFGARLEQRVQRLLDAGVTSEVIGHSREGRAILAYRWGDRTPDGTGSDAPGAATTSDAPASATESGAHGAAARRRLPGILLLSLLHPMEWIGLEANLALLEGWILRGRGEAPPSDVPLYSILIANPDGYARVEAAVQGGRSRWVRGNASCVDLNRNFPAGFRPRPGWLRSWPFYRPGPAALSEPETAAIAQWTASLDLRLSLSLHSYGRWIFYPPADTRRPGEIAGRHVAPVRRALTTAGRASYRSTQLGRWSPFFRAHGTEIDFLAASTGGLAYLVEISRGGFLRWGGRLARHPLLLFNPPDRDTELELLLPILRALAGVSK